MTVRATADPDVVDDSDRRRYEITVDGAPAGFAQYRLTLGGITFVHTVIDDAFGGRGLGSRLARAALDDARERHLAVTPACPFIAEYIRRHPDDDDLVAPA